MKCIHYIVSGRVQGVGFRFYTQKKANELNIIGTVQNLANGDVEVFASGERDAMDTFTKWLHTGPESAAVTQLIYKGQSPVSYADFSIIR